MNPVRTSKFYNDPGLPVTEPEVWLRRWEMGDIPLPRTWRSLFVVLKELDLEELSQEIEIYLTGKYDD